MTFVVTSDMHGRIDELSIPAGDVFIHAGDFTRHQRSKSDLTRFNEFLGTLPHKYKFIIGGNHEVCLSKPGNSGILNEEQLAKITNGEFVHHGLKEIYINGQRLSLFKYDTITLE